MQSTTGKPVDPDGVNHPEHYNKHPSGVEIIEVNRYLTSNTAAAFKYVMRRGIKVEAGLTQEQSIAKDLDKALWYLRDELEYLTPRLMVGWDADGDEKMLSIIRTEPNTYVRDFCNCLREWMLGGEWTELRSAISALQLLKAETYR